jgi:hypothetical protein
MHIAFLLLAGLLTAVQARPAAPHPFAGEWVANLAQSKLSPDFKAQRVTLLVALAGDSIAMASIVVDPSGKEQRAAETFRTDGARTPGTLNPGVVLMAKWLGPQVLATIAEKDGQVAALVTYQVSPDGRTLTTRSSGTMEQVIVFERK